MLGNTIKCLLLGMALGAAATIVITSSTNIKEKMKCTAEKSCDNVSTMFKLK